MRGGIAAGHPLTAEAGARVLADGGNAVDACIAAGFASWITESPLTGPGAGGFMLIHRARDRTTRVLDFFVTVPGLGLDATPVREMEAVDVDFAPESSQIFRIGAASCAVPGTVAGLEAAHRSYGSVEWGVLVQPAIELARGGVELTRAQAYLHAILDSILRHTPESRAVYERDGDRLAAGDRLEMPELAATLELLAERGARELYEGELGAAVVRHVRDRGGVMTEDDLAGYRVIRRRPLAVPFRGHEYLSNPPPSTGGILIGYALQLLDRAGRNGAAGSAEAIALLADVMREQNRARARGFMSALYRGGLAQRLFADKALADAIDRLGRPEPAAAETGGPSGTTHISVVDERGNAAALTASTGSGSGVVVPGTGIHLNIMVSEFYRGPV